MRFVPSNKVSTCRRVFSIHPDQLSRLLDDLREGHDNCTINAIDYLPSEQLPLLVVTVTEVSAAPVPGRARKLKFANKATFTRGELDAHRRVIDEIHQLQELAEVRWAAGFAQGLAEARAEREAASKISAILTVLAARGIPVDTEARARIEACQDLATIDRWIVRAATAASAKDVLAPDPR